MRLGNSAVAFDRGPDRARGRARRSSSTSVDADRALRVADRDVLKAPRAPAGARSSPRPSAAPPGKSFEVEARAAHVDAAGVGPGDRRADLARGGLRSRTRPASVQPRRRRYRIASRAPLPDSSASEPSGLKIAQVAPRTAGPRAATAAARRRRTRRSGPSHSVRDARRRQLERELVPLDDQVVVAERLPLLESHQAPESRISCATVVRVAPGHVDHAHPGELAHPRQLAPRVVARAALHRLHVAASSSSKPSALRAVSRRTRRVRAQHLLARARREHRLHARVDPRVQRLALHRQPDQQRRVAHLLAPQLRRRRRGGSQLARVEQLERAHDPLAVVRVDRLAPPTARAAASRACSAGAPVAFELRHPALAHALGRRRTQVELGQRRAQVQARAAHHDRPRARAPAAPSISACASSAYCPALNARVERQERDQPMLQLQLARARVATPVSVSRPAYTCSASAETATGSSPRARSRRASATATRGLADARRAEQRDRPRIDVGSQLMQISGSTVLLTGATGGLGQAIARALHARGGQADPHRTAHRRARAARRRARRSRALAVDLSRARRGRSSARARPARSTSSSPTPRCPPPGTLDSFTMEEIDRALDVNLRAPIALAHALVPADDRLAGADTCCSCPRSPARPPRPAPRIYNATKFGLRGFASALRADLRDSGVGVSAVFPGFIRDAGMFAEAGRQAAAGRRHAHARGRRPRRRQRDRAQPRARSTSRRCTHARRRHLRRHRPRVRAQRRAPGRL